MKRKRRIFLYTTILLFIFPVVGCWLVEGSNRSSGKLDQTDVGVTSTPTNSLLIDKENPSRTPTIAELLTTPSPIALSEPTIRICENVEDSLSNLFSQKYYQVLIKSLTPNHADYWVANPRDQGTKQVLKELRIGPLFDISRNGKFIAYVTYDEARNRNLLRISEINGKSNLVKSDLSPNFVFASWLDNQFLILWNSFTKQGDDKSVIAPVHLYNPFSETLSDIPSPQKRPLEDLYWVSPNAKFSLYIEESPSPFWVLLDFDSLSEYTLLPYQGGSSAAWNPNSKTVAISVGKISIYDAFSRKELYQIELAPLFSGSYTTESLTWDPTGRYLSFWTHSFKEGPNVPENGLYIYDSENNELRHYCSSERPPNGGIIWSPDGEFVGWTIGEAEAIYLLEVRSGRFAVWDGMRLLGWIE